MNIHTLIEDININIPNIMDLLNKIRPTAITIAIIITSKFFHPFSFVELLPRSHDVR